MSVHYPTDDCEDCGTSIEYGTADGMIQPDAEVSCPNCGAVHVVNVTEGIGEQPDAYLTLVKTGGEVIAELRAENHERYVAGVMTGEAMRNGLMTEIAKLRAEIEVRVLGVAAMSADLPPEVEARLRGLHDAIDGDEGLLCGHRDCLWMVALRDAARVGMAIGRQAGIYEAAQCVSSWQGSPSLGNDIRALANKEPP